MNIIILLLLIFISKGDSYMISTKHSKTDESVLLRKLQNLQKHNDQEITQIPTWSEMLAEVIVNRIKIFSFHKVNELNPSSAEAPKVNFFTETLSSILKIYKTYVYDRWNDKKYHNQDKISDVSNPKEVVDEPKEAIDEPKEIINPKEDVEIIEPKYHGKLCVNCTEGPADVTCPNGFEIDGNGDCVDPKVSKFIVSVPYQCPIGYRRDWFGFCRVTF